MKFKLLSLFITKLLGVDEEANKSDMYLPTRIAGSGLAMILGGFILVAAYFINKHPVSLFIAVFCFTIAVFALLCYKNQRVRVLSDEDFEYSTMFGNKYVYRFEDIKSLRLNKDSMTLFVANGKVHIESCAILSERFMNLVNNKLEEIQKSEGKTLNR